MVKRKIMIEVAGSSRLTAKGAQFPLGFQMDAEPEIVSRLKSIEIDRSFGMIPIPDGEQLGASPLQTGLERTLASPPPEVASYLMRGEMDDEEMSAIALAPFQAEGVKGIYIDARIASCRVCPGSPPVGSDRDVERLLDVAKLRRYGMDGNGVLVAIVDTGINLAHLIGQGKPAIINPGFSWDPNGSGTPGAYGVNHGTMCAFDALIAAPRCTLLDIALLRSTAPGGTVMEGLLSDAVRAYSHLRGVMRLQVLSGRFKGLVVNNSWGMFHPSWDFPVGHPGNYSDNPSHPFNRIVGTLAREGADILFAAGNCGSDCPDGRCSGVTSRAIYGANGHSQVTCVAGVDTTGDRVGYSTQGPGRLSPNKPDVCGYTHFAGSHVYPADGGTSAATPVVAGLVAALRTAKPFKVCCADSFPAAIRQSLRQTAIDKGPTGYDFDYGWGIVNGSRLAEKYHTTTASGESPAEAEDGGVDGADAMHSGDKHPGESVMELPGGFSSPAAPGTMLQTHFGRITPDSSPGLNTLTISGLPAGTRAISVWITEWVSPNNPHAGSAVFTTESVQLYENGTKCRVRFRSSWGSHLPAAAQVIFGPG